MDWTPGSQVDGFVVARVTPVDLMHSLAIELEHESSGCRIVHLANADTENLFSVTFRTPPPNNTGIPHIMEHSVLAGSERFRGKDPFFSLVKSSVASYINAMTAYDHTLYPVASTVRQDLFNLADVYWDAVFHPLLTEHTFAREGHRTEFATRGDRASDLVRRGIVYSEMQGAYSSPDSLISEEIRRRLFPETVYGRDSGGDPQHIPELTYAQYLAFHHQFYHPSNALVFLYGNVPTEEYLSFLRPRLAPYQRRPGNEAPIRQPRWSAPRKAEITYPAAPEEAGRSYLVLNWLVGDGSDPFEAMALHLLNRVLIGNEAAPLRKALIDAKLGDDLALSGAEPDTFDSWFSIGVKGADPARADAFVAEVEKTLTTLAGGIRRDAIEAAAQQLAYHTLAISENFPIHVLFRLSTRYAHHRDPLLGLDAYSHLRQVRERATTDSSFLPSMIRQKLLDNPHRLLMIARGDPDYARHRDETLKRSLLAQRQQLLPAALDVLAKRQEEFDREESESEAGDALASLPMLRVCDLPKRPRTIPTRFERDGRLDWLENDVFSNGINYVQVEVDLAHVPIELLAHGGVYTECLPKMGAAGFTYEQMAERIAAHTSGVGASLQVNGHATDSGRMVRTLQLATSFLDGQASSALAVLEDLLFGADPTNSARLADVLIQAHAAEKSFIGLEGDRIARSHAASVVSKEAWLHDLVHGLPEARLFAELAARSKRMSDAADVRGQKALDEEIERLLALRASIATSGRLYASFTGSASERGAVRAKVGEWAKRVGRGTPAEVQVVPPQPDSGGPLRLGLAAPMNVAFCAAALPALPYADPQAPNLAVAAQHLSMGYMLEEVRFKGAAYGAWSRTNLLHRGFLFGSYRDPSIARTLRVFEGAASAVKSAAWTQRELDRTILVAAKDSLRPNRPREATGTALYWHVHGLSDDVRAKFYDAMLSVTAPEAQRALVETLERGQAKAAVCVVSSREKFEVENRELGAQALRVEDVFVAG